AVAVGTPHRVLPDAALPGNVIPACRALRADRRPRAELTRHDPRTGIAHLPTPRPADRIQKIVAANLNKAGRSKRLDHRIVHLDTDPSSAVQVLLESFFVRLQRPPRSTPFPYTTLFRSAVAVGTPHRVLPDAALPGNVIPACRALRADRRPRAE